MPTFNGSWLGIFNFLQLCVDTNTDYIRVKTQAAKLALVQSKIKNNKNAKNQILISIRESGRVFLNVLFINFSEMIIKFLRL